MSTNILLTTSAALKTALSGALTVSHRGQNLSGASSSGCGARETLF